MLLRVLRFIARSAAGSALAQDTPALPGPGCVGEDGAASPALAPQVHVRVAGVGQHAAAKARAHVASDEGSGGKPGVGLRNLCHVCAQQFLCTTGSAPDSDEHQPSAPWTDTQVHAAPVRIWVRKQMSCEHSARSGPKQDRPRGTHHRLPSLVPSSSYRGGSRKSRARRCMSATPTPRWRSCSPPRT